MQFLSLKAQTSVFAGYGNRSPGKFLNERIFFNCVTCLQGTVQILLQYCLHKSVKNFSQFQHWNGFSKGA